MAKARYTIPSLDRAVQVLELLAHEQKGLTLTELTTRTGIPKSTLFRILATLENRSCIGLIAGSKKYQLGLKVWELGSAYVEQSDLDTAATAHMQELADACRESVFLGVLDAGEVVYMRRIESPHSVAVVRKLGHRAPAYCTATGEAMLAFMSEEKRERIVDQLQLEAHTPKTNTDRKALRRRLQQTQKEGVAVVDGAYNAKLLCVSAPVLDSNADVRAAVTVAMLSAEASEERVMKTKDRVRHAAAAISNELGYLPGKPPSEPPHG